MEPKNFDTLVIRKAANGVVVSPQCFSGDEITYGESHVFTTIKDLTNFLDEKIFGVPIPVIPVTDGVNHKSD